MSGTRPGVRESGSPAKSLGTYALPWAMRHNTAAIWFTPLLTDPAVHDALASAGPSHLAVGGTADPMWEPAATLTTHADLHAIDGADHAILIPGDWSGSMRRQLDVMNLVAAHVAGLRHARRPEH